MEVVDRFNRWEEETHLLFVSFSSGQVERNEVGRISLLRSKGRKRNVCKHAHEIICGKFYCNFR